MMALGQVCGVIGSGLALGLVPVHTAHAVEVHPSPAQVAQAVERGRSAAAVRTPPDRLYAWFGPDTELEPRGFLMTKMAGLAVMSAHFALRSESPSESDIRQILDEKTLLVSVTIFGNRPNLAVETYMVLVQGGHSIKPIKVRFDGTAARTSAWPHAPAYKAKVVAMFAYDDFDPLAKTTVSVFPASGGEITFALDLSRIE